MKFNGFRHLREGAKGLVRNGWMTFASVSAVTVTLLLVGIFAMLMFNVNKISDNVEKDVEIQVFVEREADQRRLMQLVIHSSNYRVSTLFVIVRKKKNWTASRSNLAKVHKRIGLLKKITHFTTDISSKLPHQKRQKHLQIPSKKWKM